MIDKMERRRERAGRDGRCAHEKAGEKSVTAEIRRKAPKSIGGRKAGFARK